MNVSIHTECAVNVKYTPDFEDSMKKRICQV